MAKRIAIYMELAEYKRPLVTEIHSREDSTSTQTAEGTADFITINAPMKIDDGFIIIISLHVRPQARM